MDLTRPAEEPLTPRETREVAQHLTFLRRHKSALRLSFNAQEDLLVNGARPPSDRGQVKHLLGKLDRASVERALSRDTLLADATQRTAFLAGVIRLLPDLDLLLAYLEGLSKVADRREAAQAFAFTVERIDFQRLSVRQASQILGLIAETFRGPDRVRALFGLLDNATFRAIASRAMEGDVQSTMAPLAAVYRAVVEGTPPADEDDPRLFHQGLELLLDAPEAVLKSYPEPVRARLAQHAIEALGARAKEPVRRLIASLPAKDPAYLGLRILRAEQLLSAQDLDEARSLLNAILSSSPNHRWAEERRAALGWRPIGPLLVGPAIHGTQLHRALWLERAALVVARIAPPSAAGRLATEARAHAELGLPLIPPVVTHGLSADGHGYLAMAVRPRPLSFDAGKPVAARLELALGAIQLLSRLAQAGYVIPDLSLHRWIEGRVFPLLANLDGLSREEPGRAAMAHGSVASAFTSRLLADLGPEAKPRSLRGKLPASSALLTNVLLEALVAAG